MEFPPAEALSLPPYFSRSGFLFSGALSHVAVPPYLGSGTLLAEKLLPNFQLSNFDVANVPNGKPSETFNFAAN